MYRLPLFRLRERGRGGGERNLSGRRRYNDGMPLLVAAAASLTDVLQIIGKQFTDRTQTPVRFSFGASGTLARQIQAGAPVDVFVSAAPQEMDAVEKAGLLLPETRRIVAANRLVLIVPRSGTLTELKGLLSPKIRRVAIARPELAPAGRYAQEMLIERYMSRQVEAKAVYGRNVRQVLTYVAGGNADAGFVFRTDALSEPRVKIVLTVSERDLKTPIVYPAAALARSSDPDAARQFVTALAGKEAQAVFARYGFLPPSTA